MKLQLGCRVKRRSMYFGFDLGSKVVVVLLLVLVTLIGVYGSSSGGSEGLVQP